jgi:hypothetical protein
VRLSTRASIAALALLACVLNCAQPALAASQVAKVSATVAKPLTLARVQDLNLGTIVLGPGTWSGATVAIARGGAFSCASANVTCIGTTQVAKYVVTGSNNQPIRITAPNVTLVNQSDPTRTLVLVVDSPGTITLPNSGNNGVQFPLGGSINLSSTTAGGTYAGTFNVTIDY